jgi:hypothetical protein
VKAYENWKECETLERLESIKNNSNAIHMESLAIRERILGKYDTIFLLNIVICILYLRNIIILRIYIIGYILKYGNKYVIIFTFKSLKSTFYLLGCHNPELPHPIVFRGAIFADNARFDRCIDLWLHALKLRQLNNTSIVTDLLRFAQVFSQMIHVGVDLDFSQVLNVLEASVIELSRNKIKIQNPDPKDDIDQYIVSSISKI